MARFGLIGRNIDYSFSRGYFNDKFAAEGLDHTYENFDLPDAASVGHFLADAGGIRGLNVTIPYKATVIDLLDAVDPEAATIGAVNTIAVDKEGYKTGFNTDHIGFKRALQPFLPLSQPTALILGSGGASKAIAYALDQLGIAHRTVSRATGQDLTYEQLDRQIVREHALVVNCTPLGTHPNTATSPDFPYAFLGPEHLLFDLVYNPEVTTFMDKGRLHGAQATNGYRMLVEQAEAAWSIWTRHQ